MDEIKKEQKEAFKEKKRKQERKKAQPYVYVRGRNPPGG